MRLVAAATLVLLAAAPAHARPSLVARGELAPSGPVQTTLTLADPLSTAAQPGQVTVAGDVWSIEGSPDGAQYVALGRAARQVGDFEPRQRFAALTFVDAATAQQVGEPVELEGDPLTALWADPARLLVVTDRAANGLHTRVVTIDAVAHAVVGATELRGAPGDALRLRERLLVVDTNRRNTKDGTITPALCVFAADGTLERRISLRALKRTPDDRLTYVQIAADRGQVVAFSWRSGRFATVDVDTGKVTARGTRLATQRREPLLGATARRLVVARGSGERPRVFAIDRRTGAATFLRRTADPRPAPGGWLATGSTGVRRFDARGHRVWKALADGAAQCSTLRYGAMVYACDGQGVHALRLSTGEETGAGPGPTSYPGMIGEADGGYLYPYALGGTELDP
jgi:hypothetical protein